VQVLEIENENIRDLFVKANPKGGLKVKIIPKIGVEVVGSTKFDVSKSVAEAQKRIETAYKNRTISRAHTVVTIAIKRFELNATGKPVERYSKINLVTLAGSERDEIQAADHEDVSARKSLLALFNVLTAVLDNRNNPFVPYGDSNLTRMLQDSLGGTAKTIMLFTISPAAVNFLESKRTLEYASDVQSMQNVFRTNVKPKESLLKFLREDIERLKIEIEGLKQELGSASKPQGQASKSKKKAPAKTASKRG